jgi:integrase
VSKRIASIREYTRKADVLTLANEIMADVNEADVSPHGSMSLTQFAEGMFMPYANRQLRPSTRSVYESVWKNHLRTRVGIMRVRDFRTFHGERLMADLAEQTGMNRASLGKVKNVLGAMFVYAKRQGVIHGPNPMQDVSIPKTAPESEETYAYSLEEITRMLLVLSERDALLVGLAGFAGLRRGEIRGLLWENCTENVINVSRSIWLDFVSQPKTKSSKASVPIIAPLRKLLERYRDLQGDPTSGQMFLGIKKGKPLHVNNIGNREIAPRLKKLGIEWHGWHCLRRGLGSNLYRLGVPDKVIQQILRHSNVSTTLRFYVKTTQGDSLEAMKRLEQAIEQTGTVQ